jgi:hypothetical protein
MGSWTPNDKQGANARTRAHKTPQRALHRWEMRAAYKASAAGQVQQVTEGTKKEKAKPSEARRDAKASEATPKGKADLCREGPKYRALGREFEEPG